MNLVQQVRQWFVNPPAHAIGGKLALSLADQSQKVHDALAELVATKELHDQLEALKPLPPAREEEYRVRRVLAWSKAREALALYAEER